MTLNTADSYALSPTQEGMLFHHVRGNGAGVDVEQIEGRLEESVDPDAFRRAWKSVAETHEQFRVSFEWENREEPVQTVHDDVDIPFSFQDWRDLSDAEQEERFDQLLASDRRRGFELSEPPLWRVQLFRTGEEQYRLVWSFHHILLDGRSFPVVLEDVFEAYGAIRSGEEPELEAPRPFSDHVEWVRERDPSEREEFWSEALSGYRSPARVDLSEPERAGGESDGGEPPRPFGEVSWRLSRSTTRALRELEQSGDFTMNNLVQGAWALLLSRYSGEQDVVFGAARACRYTSVEGAGDMVGVFINTLPVRARIEPERPAAELMEDLRDWHVSLRDHEHTPLVDVQKWGDVPPGEQLFDSILVYDRERLDETMKAMGPEWEERYFELHERTGYPLTLYGYGEDELLLELCYERARFSDDAAERMLGHLATLLREIAEDSSRPLASLSTLTDEERSRQLVEWNDTEQPFPEDRCVHELIEEQAERTPDDVAVVFEGRELTYRQLDARANVVARRLRDLGVGPDAVVGLSVERSLEMMVGLLGILKAGGAYLPLDPTYPEERLSFLLEDAGAPVLVTERSIRDRFPEYGGETALMDELVPGAVPEDVAPPDVGVDPDDLAYVMYTSGSTGRPKGVEVQHRNVVNFFTGMDDRVDHDPSGVWLALTSLSFDISVLELFWTLSRGFRVVIHRDEREAAESASDRSEIVRDVDFGLFYFGSMAGQGTEDPYRLLMEGAKFADRNGFSSVWTPERHFHDFGGLFPNPSVLGAALAEATEQIGIRAGSVVSPLHHSARVAEEWAVVDNLSDGRVGLSFASGWQPEDFVLRPEGWEDRKEDLYEDIETVRRLWRGEELQFPGHDGEPVDVRTLPRPVQDDLPVWVTSAGSIETYRSAGRVGAHLLTHLLGQSVEELSEKIDAYREARREAGHDPEAGTVSVMLHTFVGEDEEEVREIVREPMKSYLRSAVSLIEGYASEWTAYSRRAKDAMEASGDEFDDLPEEDLDALLEFSFQRYFETHGLFGSVSRCVDMIGRLSQVGVDEVACLVDFGVDRDLVLSHLEPLAEVRRRVREARGRSSQEAESDYSFAAEIRRHDVTHVQCTPSQARLLLADGESREALASVETFLVGGEALPGSLAEELDEAVGGRVVNMYGPTETTIWSSTQEVREEDFDEQVVPIGRPIANTRFYVLDRVCDQPQPVGAAGELCIGGAGVVRGYLDRPELTEEKFVSDPFFAGGDGRMYRTGDLVRYRENGNLEFLGRIDHQVKIRGHRIELAEIEACLEEEDGVDEAVVVARSGNGEGQSTLVAYFIPDGSTDAPSDSELRDRLRRRLPDVMVPSAWVRIEEMPLTPNGKVDRSALPEPSRSRARGDGELAAPESPLEQQVADIWCEVLGTDEVGVDDNFFDLGGHSLLTVQVHNLLSEELGADVRITDLFRYPTVSSLAEYLAEDGDSAAEAAEEAHDRADKRRQAMRRRRTGGATS